MKTEKLSNVLLVFGRAFPPGPEPGMTWGTYEYSDLSNNSKITQRAYVLHS